MKIKVVSDGTTEGTKVLDADSGEPVPGVQMVNFMATVDGTEALLHVVGIPCEIVTDARATLLPDMNPYQATDIMESE